MLLLSQLRVELLVSVVDFHLQGVRIDAQRRRDVAGRRDTVVLGGDETSEPATSRVHVPGLKILLFSTQYALCWEALGDVSHVAVQLKICHRSGLRTHTNHQRDFKASPSVELWDSFVHENPVVAQTIKGRVKTASL